MNYINIFQKKKMTNFGNRKHESITKAIRNAGLVVN